MNFRPSRYLALSLLVVLTFAVFLPAITYGQIKPPTVGLTSSADSLKGFACQVAGWIFTFAIIFSIILAILTGIQYMRASGDPEKVSSAHHRLRYLAIGIAVALLARVMPTVINTVLHGTGGGGLDVCSGQYQ